MKDNKKTNYTATFQQLSLDGLTVMGVYLAALNNTPPNFHHYRDYLFIIMKKVRLGKPRKFSETREI